MLYECCIVWKITKNDLKFMIIDDNLCYVVGKIRFFCHNFCLIGRKNKTRQYSF